MQVHRPADAGAFLTLAGPLLERNEARNQLALGIAGTVREHPDAYETSRFWVVMDDAEPAAAALRTSPYNLVLADPLSETALANLIDDIAVDDPDVPGIVGNVPHIEDAAAVLAAATGRRAEMILSQGVYALHDVRETPSVPGEPREATSDDRDLLRRWMTDFLVEAVPEPRRHIDQLERTLDVRFSSGDSGFWFWQDGEPVSLAGFSARTPTGIRVGPVYTPSNVRRRGYATALVAELSRWLLRQGHRACFLFTDLANPTSNRIYVDIGYERVGDSMEFVFRTD